MPVPEQRAHSASADVLLTTLGDSGLWRVGSDGGRERLLDPGKPLALLIYLACAPNREATRDELTALLWSNAERERNKNSLRQTIWQLRSRLGDGLLVAARDRLLLAPIASDRDAFVAAWTAGDVERVMALYTGEFVSAFATPGGAGFEEWAEHERLRLRRIFVHSADALVQQRLAEGRAREALVHARRARDVDRLNQQGWRRVFECVIAAGDSIGAQVEADALDHLASSEDLQLEPETRTVLRAVRSRVATSQTHGSTKASLTIDAELVGREREFALIMTAWADSMRGQTRRIHVRAPAGLGKTRLLTDVHNRLRSASARSIYLGAEFGTRDIPYAFAAEIAARLAKLRGAGGISRDSAAALIALDPALSTLFKVARDASDGDEALRRRALAMRELLVAIADEQPVTLLIDDLHWADLASFRMLDVAIGSLERRAVLIITAARPTVDEQRAPSKASVIELAPLGVAAIHALLSSIGELPMQRWADLLPQALSDATAGSPLLVIDTLLLLLERGLIALNDARWETTDPDGLFRGLTQGSALRGRIASLAVDEQQLLVTLAVAGLPLPRDVLAVAGAVPASAFDGAIANLEKRGLIVARDDRIVVSHDEHAAVAVDTASPDAKARAAGALGTALLASSDNDVRWLRVAGALLARGLPESTSALTDAFASFVRVQRRHGSGRSNRALAQDFLGPMRDDQHERMLVKSLSWRMRTQLSPRGRMAAAVAIAAALVLGTSTAWSVFRRPVPISDVILVAERLTADRSAYDLFPIPLDAGQWARNGVLEVALPRRAQWRLKSVVGNGGHDWRPDGRAWTAGVSVADSGVIDVYDLSLDGGARRLTVAGGDDYEPSWAPDSRHFVFVTSQWSRHGHYDLAVYDTLTRMSRQLTSGDETDIEPGWSNDGSRIAFVRLDAAGRRALCVIDADGSHLSCGQYEQDPILHVTRWVDSHDVYARKTVNGRASLARIDVDAGMVTDVDTLGVDAMISPDGRFALCQCPRKGYAAGTWLIYPVERPQDFTIIRLADADSAGTTFDWAPSTPRARSIDAITIANDAVAAVVGGPHRLRATGLDVERRPLDAGVVRWRSTDTLVATIDALGNLIAKRAGKAVIVASAGGWREAHSSITIRDSHPRVLLDEQWTDPLQRTWSAFGIPSPTIVDDRQLGRAFLNGGDGSFFSGAYTKATFDASDGLWVELRMSTPISSRDSQDQVAGFFAMSDSSLWARWDHVTGDGPPNGIAVACKVRYPYGTIRKHLGEQMLASWAATPTYIDMPEDIYRGRPYTLVLQVLPDGRCGAAIDGHVVSIADGPMSRRDLHIMLSGNTVGTRMLVGRLRVGTDLAPGIRWNEVQTSQQSAHKR